VRSLRVLILPLILYAVTAQAQPQAERWYRVELLIFAQPGGGAGAEQWPATPALHYPSAARFLVDPARVAANSEEYGSRGEIGEFGRQIIVLPPPAEPAIPEPHDTGTGESDGDTPGRAPAPLESPPEETPLPGESTGSPVPMTPPPFVTLPAGDLEYAGKAAYMVRNGGYRVLFHEAWLQPVPEQAEALPIILDRSGDGGPWPELQGSILLYLARYLHLETNLWLNTQGQYFPGVWQMPPPPLSPPSLIVEEPEALPSTADARDSATPALSPPPVRDIAAAPTGEPGAPDSSTGQGVTEIEETGPVYPFRHAVTLRQTRRMRSSELHYMDHPMFGLVINLTPVSEEELADLAAKSAGSEDEPET